MAYNKVQIEGGDTLIDMTDATLSSSDTNKILSGESAYGNDGQKIVGTIGNSSITKSSSSVDPSSLKCGEWVQVEDGYKSSDTTITAVSLASQTPATATASDIASGKSGVVNGTDVMGNISVRSNGTKTTQSAGYGVDSNGVWTYFPSGIWKPDSTGESYTYSKMPNKGADVSNMVWNQTHYIQKGYHNGSGYCQSPNVSGTLSATANGTYTIRDYKYISVNVPLIRLEDTTKVCCFGIYSENGSYSSVWSQVGNASNYYALQNARTCKVHISFYYQGDKNADCYWTVGKNGAVNPDLWGAGEVRITLVPNNFYDIVLPNAVNFTANTSIWCLKKSATGGWIYPNHKFMGLCWLEPV